MFYMKSWIVKSSKIKSTIKLKSILRFSFVDRKIFVWSLFQSSLLWFISVRCKGKVQRKKWKGRREQLNKNSLENERPSSDDSSNGFHQEYVSWFQRCLLGRSCPCLFSWQSYSITFSLFQKEKSWERKKAHFRTFLLLLRNNNPSTVYCHVVNSALLSRGWGWSWGFFCL